MSKPTSPLDKRSRDLLGWVSLIVVLIVGILGAAYLGFSSKLSRDISLPVPITYLPAYHVIQGTDVTTATLQAGVIPDNAIREASRLVGLYTLVPLTANKPVATEQVHEVPDPTLITGTVAIGVPSTSAMVLGGNLRAGDVVDLITAPLISETHPTPTPALFQNIFVLDVKPVPQSRSSEEGSSDNTFVVVIALPLDRRLEFAGKTAGATLLITSKR